MDAIELLSEDHRRVEQLFQLAESQVGDMGTRRETFRLIRASLLQHAEIEEAIFYPACALNPDLKALVERSIEEHRDVRDLLVALDHRRGPDDFDSLLDELQDNVQEHVREEEGELFPKVRHLLSAEQLQRLGQAMAAAKATTRPKAA